MAELNARIIAKASATTGEEPVASDLEVAELAVNTADGKIFTKHTDNSIVVISGGTGGGGATSLDDLSDVAVGATARTLIDFETTDLSLTNPISSPTGARQTTTVFNGSYAYEVPSGQGYGDGSKFVGGLRNTQARYDILSLHIRSDNALSTNNRVSLGGSKAVIASGSGWTLYTRDTGFGFYGDGAFQEIGTRPAMAADTWHHVIYVLDWAGDRSSPPAISMWIDGSQTINNVTPTNSYSQDASEDVNFHLVYSTGSGSGDTKYWDDIRILQYDSIDWNMTDASLNMNSAVTWIDAQLQPLPLGALLRWDGFNFVTTNGNLVESTNGKTGVVSLGIQDMDDLDLEGKQYLFFPDYQLSWTSSMSDRYRVDDSNPLAIRFATRIDDVSVNGDMTGLSGTEVFLVYGDTTVGPMTATIVQTNTAYTLLTSPSITSEIASEIETWGLGGGGIYFVSSLLTTSVAKTYAVDGGVLQWSQADEAFKVDKLGIDDLSDVDTTTTLPTDGQALTWVAANNQWEPADASGGGGAVNSVAGKTGAVTLEISDNTDVSTKTTYSQSGGAAVYSVSGNATGYVQRILLNSDRLIFANGDVTPGSTLEYLRDTAVLPFTIQTYVDGVLSTDATVTVVNTTSDPSALWITADWTDAEVNAASTFFIEATADPTDGQILQWDSAEQEFRPETLPDATATRALLGIGEYADDAAAGTGGVASGAMYYNTTSSDYRLKT